MKKGRKFDRLLESKEKRDEQKRGRKKPDTGRRKTKEMEDGKQEMEEFCVAFRLRGKDRKWKMTRRGSGKKNTMPGGGEEAKVKKGGGMNLSGWRMQEAVRGGLAER